MGITFLAAGTSVPEAVSSVIVAKQGMRHDFCSPAENSLRNDKGVINGSAFRCARGEHLRKDESASLFSPCIPSTVLLLSRTRLDGHQQFDRIEHVRHIAVSRITMADQVVFFAHAARQALHQYKFRRAGVQRDIVTVDADAAVHRVRLQQVPAR